MACAAIQRSRRLPIRHKSPPPEVYRLLSENQESSPDLRASSGRSGGALRRPLPEDDEPTTPFKRLRRRTSDPVPPQEAAPEPEQAAPGYPLVGREAECRRLDSFLQACLASPSSRGGALYVSGGPGTGKTCCTRAAAGAWRLQHPETCVLEVNCFNLPQRSVAGLFQHLAGPSGAGRTGQKLMAAAAEQLKRLGPSVVVIVDEADQLVSRQPAQAAAALEALLSMPRLPGAPALALVAIANAVDLLQRTAVPLAQGRCTALLFEPYGLEQLRSIGKARLAAAGDAGVQASADLGKVNLEVCARRLASRSGDCRQLVRLCEQAVRQARYEALEAAAPSQASAQADGAGGEVATPEKARRPRTMAGLREVQVDPLRAVAELPLEQQVLLCALTSSKGEAVRFLDLCARYRELSVRLHQPTNLACKEQVRGALVALEQRGLLALHERRVAGRGGGRGSRSSGGGLRGPLGSESVAELAVSREKMKESLSEANDMLAKCLE